jgi:hypothetical protein
MLIGILVYRIVKKVKRFYYLFDLNKLQKLETEIKKKYFFGHDEMPIGMLVWHQKNSLFLSELDFLKHF